MNATVMSASRRAATVFALAVLSSFAIPSIARAINNALGPNGSQVYLAKQQFGVDGTIDIFAPGFPTPVNLGQVEGGRPGDPQVMLPSVPAVPERNHPNVNPAGVNVGTAFLGISPPPGGLAVEGHATEVAGMMISNHATFRGVAETASLYSSAFGSGVQDQQLVIQSAEWVRAQNGGVPDINMSFGVAITNTFYPGGGAGVRDGRSLLSQYVDFTARTRDILFVQAAPESGPISFTTPDDAYNNLVVAFSQQATAGQGRFDRVDAGSFDNMVAPHGGAATTRTKIDMVAPGSFLVLPLPGGAFTQDTFTDVDGSGGWDGIRRDGNGNGFWDPPTEPYLDVDNSATFNAGDLFFDNNFDGVRNDAPNGDYFLRPGAAGPPTRSEPVQDVDGNGAINFHTAGSSFAAPMVNGMAGLLDEYARENFLADNRMLKKAALMNSASKHLLQRPTGAAPVPAPGTAWPIAYAARWTSSDPENTIAPAPLDPQSGVGQLNGLAALRQYRPGSTDVGLRSGNVAGGGADDLQLNGGADLKAGSLVSATLVWERVITNAANIYTVGDYAGNAPTDLDLQLVRLDGGGGTRVAWSRSTPDNVEHIYFNVPTDGKYALRVRNFGGDATDYALGFSSGTTDGLAFGIKPGARGRNTLTTNAPFPNDVNSLGASGPAAFQTQSEVFVSGGDGKNMARLSGALQTRSRVGPFNAPPAAMSLLGGGPGVAGLTSNDTVAGTDNMGDLSWGRDGTRDAANAATALPGVLYFSVANTAGAGGGDVLKSRTVVPFGAFQGDLLDVPSGPANTVYRTATSLGLAGPIVAPATPADDLDALELDSPLKDPDGAGALRALDFDGDGMPNSNVYFTLAPGSPSLGGARTTDDIFFATSQDPTNNFDLNAAGAFTFGIFAPGGTLGLQAGDIIDALVLSDVGTIGTLDANVDEALFSLATGSPSLLGGKTAGDVFYTKFDSNPFTTFATAAFLGIAGQDLDALDIAPVPEPATLLLLLIGCITLGLARRRTLSTTGGPIFCA